MTTMIALVGEQPLPNFLPVKHFHPSDVVLVYTSTTRQTYKNLEATLQKKVKVHELEAHPFDIPAIVNTISNGLDKIPTLPSQPLIFNLTGGTKPMSLAAYQVALQRNAPVIYLQSEGKQTCVYHYTWENHRLIVAKNELLPELLQLQDIFDLYLGPGNWEEKGPSKDEGGPLEEAIANKLREAGYEVMVGIKTMNNNIDVDVAVRFGNQYAIIEAKTGKSGKSLDGIKQLSTAARLLGTYSQTLSVITVPPEPTQKMLAEASRIQVVSLPTYERGSRILPQADSTMLFQKVEEILKGKPEK